MQPIFYIWIAVLVIAIIIELATTELVSMWFALGALFGIFTSITKDIPYYVSLIVFLAVSFLSLILLRPIAVKYLFKGHNDKTNLDRYIDTIVTIEKSVPGEAHPTCKINDIIWNVKEIDEKDLMTNDKVKILFVDGNKLIVKKVDSI